MIPDPGNVQIVQRLRSVVVAHIGKHYVRFVMLIQLVRCRHPNVQGPEYEPNCIWFRVGELRCVEEYGTDVVLLL